MQRTADKYDLAVKLEKAGNFVAAYNIFQACLTDSNLDYGDILFKCGWCLENISNTEFESTVSYYLKAGATSKSTDSRMNSFFRAGWILMHVSKNEEAIKAFKYAIQIGHSEGNYGTIYLDSLYWCAVCLESEGRFLDSIYLYRAVKEISSLLNPESRYREIICLIAVGLYADAIQLCNSFVSPPPAGFPADRYSELKILVEKEKNLLTECCNEFPKKRIRIN
jgi:tetratricopeptide (TPR) repeat protein